MRILMDGLGHLDRTYLDAIRRGMFNADQVDSLRRREKGDGVRRPNRPTPPELGQRIRASGYMVRYYTPPGKDEGVYGWKRRCELIDGVYFGTRRLKIAWWWIELIFDDHHDGDPVHHYKALGHIRVYAIAVNRRSVRYVLPRDVEMGEG